MSDPGLTDEGYYLDMAGFVADALFDITPSDTLPVNAHKGLLIEGAGDISITTRLPAPYTPATGTPAWIETTTILTVTAGKMLPISVYRVNATGTTATGINGYI